MTTTIIAQERAKALLKRFAGAGAPPIIALSPELIDVNARRLKLTKTEVSSRYKGRAFALLHATDPKLSSVWALPTVGSYKKVYELFLGLAYNLANPKTPPLYDVDHLRAKSLTPANCFIRLEAVGASANRSHGGGYESQMKDTPVTAARRENQHVHGSMSWMVAMKLAGVLSPVLAHNPDAAVRRQEAIRVFQGIGFSRREIEEGLDSLEALAARR